MRLLFVCLGNICRSPAAHGVAEHLIAGRGLDWQVDSAGTGAWHIGERPDPRMMATAAARGIDLAPQRARQAIADDFHAFDHIYAMDQRNFDDLKDIRPETPKAQLDLFLGSGDVPDPYYGGDQGFEHVLDLIQTRMESLLTTLSKA